MLSKLEWQKTLRGADDLSDAEFRVLMIISTYTDAHLGNARPGLMRLAADCRLTEKWTRKALGSLVAKGYLEQTEKGGNQYGKGRANVYRLLPRLSTRGALSDPLEDPEGGHSTSGKGGTARPSRGSLSGSPSGLSSDQPSARARPRDGGACQVCGLQERYCRRQTERTPVWGHEYKPSRTKVDVLGFVVE